MADEADAGWKLIPEDVFNDFRSRTIVEVKDVQWANEEQTMLNANVLFEELRPMGHVPYTTMDGADTNHGQEIWDNALNGDYGPIAPYEPPPPQPLAPLTRRQLRLGLFANGITTADVEEAIATIPDAMDRAVAEIEWADASIYERDHPLIEQVGGALGLTSEQIDTMWLEASNL